jgi:acyl-CoA reductase-like NAD-dependent aldehyde dehydrogenase
LADEIVYEDAAVKIVATHTPLGVVAAICPWNFPLVLAMGKIAAGLLTGNCVIVKPSPLTPYTTLKVVELALNIFPPGVVQVLNGGAELGRDITIHPGINKISFTGSTATGRKIMENAASSLKRVTLELGGNDATIVCDDVDVASVAQQVAQGCLFHSGQMCVATKRVYVHKSIYVEFLAALVKEFEAVTTHTPYDTPSTFGPLQNHMQFSIIRDYIEDCKAQGYKFSSGGKVEEGPGLWIQPTIVDRPPDDSLVVAGEQFGECELRITLPKEFCMLNAPQGLLRQFSSGILRKRSSCVRTTRAQAWVRAFGRRILLGLRA